MTKQLLAWTAAAVLASLLAESVQAQTTTTVVNSGQVVSTRPGLLGRLRARRQRLTITPTTTMATTTQTSSAPSIGVQQTQSTSGVQQAQYAPIQGSGVQQAQATQPASSTTTMNGTTTPVVERRMGLLARIRARRGR